MAPQAFVYPDIFVVQFLSLLRAPHGLRALDAGCGAGRNSLYLAHHDPLTDREGYQVVAIDSSAAMLAKGRQSARELGLEVTFLQGRVEALPLASECFDVVLCTSVLESLSAVAAETAAQEFRRVLRAGGYLLAVTAAQEGSDPDSVSREPDAPHASTKARLTSQEALLRWFSGFHVVSLLHLQMEQPSTIPVRAQWALIARRSPP